MAPSLEIVYYDQLRAADRRQPQRRSQHCQRSETVSIDGRSRHVITYLQDFLFAPEARPQSGARALSGGETQPPVAGAAFH